MMSKTDLRRKYDWCRIQIDYDSGETVSDLKVRYGFSSEAATKAVKRGDLVLRRSKLSRVLAGSGENYPTSHLKEALIKCGKLKNECMECHSPPIWMNKKLVMVLDHLNGFHKDDRISNLRLLCPNCNSQTPTFSGRRRPYK